MARCLNCIHCDVCDSDRHDKERLYGDCSDFLHDVVPREEVDRLRHTLDSYAIQYGTVKDQHAVIDRIKADTVRKMQEMLLAKKVTYGNITFRVVPVDDIDQIANQLLEETK